MVSSRDELIDFWGSGDDAPAVPDTRADGRLYRVPLGRLSPNLVNPRTDFGTEADLLDFGKSLARRQNQPCPVVSRPAYLKLWPEHSDRIGDIDYVLVSGERRYRAAGAVGLAALDCVVNDDFAQDRKTFMEAVVSENVDRQNFDAIEEAYAVKALVTEFGSNRAVAQHFERADGWVTQRVYLTHLAPGIQDLVRKKAIPLEAARSLGKLTRDNDLSAEQQLTWWEEEQQRRREAAQAKAVAKKHAKAQQSAGPGNPAAPVPQAPPQAPPVKKPVPTREQPAGFTAVKQQAPTPAPSAVQTPSEVSVPEPRPETTSRPEASTVDTDPKQPIRLLWEDGLRVAELVIEKMERDEMAVLYERIGKELGRHDTVPSS
jgi:ParB family chromosome partitioning protein